jgi:L-lactate utilization protein LutC
MTSSRDIILGKLRAARRPFPDAPPRPQVYLPVIPTTDASTPALVERFSQEMAALKGKAVPVNSDAEACAVVLQILRDHQITAILAWDFAHIPIKGLREALIESGITITVPNLHDERTPSTMQRLDRAGAGLSGADAAIAATGTLILKSGEGKGRIPTVLPPVWIAIITSDQLVERLEDWLVLEREGELTRIVSQANLAFVSGPSRTGDIEMQLILGVHGPKTEYVVIKQ